MKNSKGITLVALVITIVVLLILAGVTISMVLGPNGVLSNARQAREESALNVAKEAMTTALGSIQTEFYKDEGATAADYVTYEKFKAALPEYYFKKDDAPDAIKAKLDGCGVTSSGTGEDKVFEITFGDSKGNKFKATVNAQVSLTKFEQLSGQS